MIGRFITVVGLAIVVTLTYFYGFAADFHQEHPFALLWMTFGFWALSALLFWKKEGHKVAGIKLGVTFAVVVAVTLLSLLHPFIESLWVCVVTFALVEVIWYFISGKHIQDGDHPCF